MDPGFAGLNPGMLPPMGGGMMLPPGLAGPAGELPFGAPGMQIGSFAGQPGQHLQQPGFPGQQPGPYRESVFHKTRICQKFMEGACTMGDRCNYAHGEAELRTLTPEGQQVLEAMGRGGRGGAGPGPSPPPSKRRRGGGGGSAPEWQPGQGAERAGVRSTPFKSRLCTQFMQRGKCSYGPSCHFAHGYEDLQAPEQQGMPGGPMDGAQLEAMRRAGMMLPGAPGMMPPEMMAMAAMGGLPGGPGLMHQPRPPPGPPPGAPPAMMLGGMPQQSPDQFGFIFDGSRTPTRLPSEVPYLSRVRAACLLMRVGAAKPRDVGQDAVEATVAGMQTGEAFEGNVYADALSLYAH